MNAEHFNKFLKFSAVLIETQDLDPVYVALKYSGFDQNRLKRLVLAYSCLYHLGAATYLSQYKGATFWKVLEEAAVNVGLKWPRGAERRHWRGQQAIDSFNYLREGALKPEQVIDVWFEEGDQTFKAVTQRIQYYQGYGPWIAFKLADIGERVLGYPVDFSDCELGIYSEPRAGAALLATGNAEEAISNATLTEVMQTVLDSKIGKFKAPPLLDRKINVQEVETCLCKYKSHVGGHYPLGKDTREVYHGLSDIRWLKYTVALRTAITPLWRQWP